MTTLLQCPNCFAPLPPPGSGHATCRFCGATSIVKGGGVRARAAPQKEAKAPADPFGAKALALDFEAQHGVDLTKDGQALERFGDAWSKANVELRHVKKTEINLPFITSTKNGPLHYQREVDAKAMASLLAVAKKLG